MIASMSVVAHSRTALSSSRRSQSIGFSRRLGRLDAEDRVAFRHPPNVEVREDSWISGPGCGKLTFAHGGRLDDSSGVQRLTTKRFSA